MSTTTAPSAVANPAVKEIEPSAAKDLLARGGCVLVDVREPDEYQIARVAGVTLLPLSTLPQRFTELDPNQQIYIHCKAGKRSMKALEFLRQQGFKYLKSVKGGIDAWSDEIDSSVPKY